MEIKKCACQALESLSFLSIFVEAVCGFLVQYRYIECASFRRFSPFSIWTTCEKMIAKTKIIFKKLFKSYEPIPDKKAI